MPKWLMILLVVGYIKTGLSQTYTVETVPNPKLVNNSYVSNPDHILGQSTEDQINKKLSALEAKTTLQVAVVAIQSIGEADIFNFTQSLYERWGIGGAAKSNGLLILLVIDQRTVRFHTGYGLEGVLPDVVCKQVQRKSMLPAFEVEDYDRGVLSGVEDVILIVSNPEYAEEMLDDSRREQDGWDDFFVPALISGSVIILIWFGILMAIGVFVESKQKEKKKDLFPEMRMRRSVWLMLFAFIPIGLLLMFNFFNIKTDNHILVSLLGLYAYFALTLIYKRVRMRRVTNRLMAKQDYFAATTFFQDYQSFWVVMAILFPVPLLLLLLEYLNRKRSFRNHPRNCKSCGKPLQKLDEKADDDFLKKSQVFEEQLHSVDYDVWHCTECKNVELLNYINRFSKYKPCSACGTRACYTESQRTVSSPTYTSTGTGQQTDRCKFCNHALETSYSIARLTPPSESRSSSSSSGGSSGGSWGGGHSGGGGASSSW